MKSCLQTTSSSPDPQPQVDDEQHVAIEPAARKRFEQANAVDVEPVERRVRQAAEQRERIEPAKAHRQPAARPLAASRLPTVPAPQDAGERQRQQQPGNRPMGDPAPEAEVLHPVEPEEAGRVDIGQVRADHQRGHGEAGLPLEPRLADQRADQAVRQVIHAVYRGGWNTWNTVPGGKPGPPGKRAKQSSRSEMSGSFRDDRRLARM